MGRWRSFPPLTQAKPLHVKGRRADVKDNPVWTSNIVEFCSLAQARQRPPRLTLRSQRPPNTTSLTRDPILKTAALHREPRVRIP
jgi:hypothetical protein